MLIPTLPDWKVETIGDDIAWMKFGSDGQLYAVNPEAGFFGVAPGTGAITNPNAIDTIGRNSIFTNCAKTDDGDVWWEGLTAEPPAHAIDWRRNDWTPDVRDACGASERAVHDAGGAVPIDRARVGGPERACRSTRCCSAAVARRVVPLVLRGARLGARRVPRLDDVLGDDRSGGRPGRAAALGSDGDAAVLRLPHGRLLPPLAEARASARARKLPRIFYVNWFRKGEDGKFLWPGYGENSRVLAWIFRRCQGKAEAVETAIGLSRRSARAASTPTALDVTAGDDGGAAQGRSRGLARSSSRRCTSTTRSSERSCRPSCTRSSTRSTQRLHAS